MMDETELQAELEKTHDAAWGWALSCCTGSGLDARDVLQTAYLKVLNGKAKFGGKAQFRTWLFGVIRLTALEQGRRAWFGRWFTGANAERLRPIPQPEPGIDADAVTLLRNHLKLLPARQREVMHLVFYQDLSLSQAAEIMGVSVGSTRQHYDRAKRRMREALEPVMATI